MIRASAKVRNPPLNRGDIRAWTLSGGPEHFGLVRIAHGAFFFAASGPKRSAVYCCVGGPPEGVGMFDGGGPASADAAGAPWPLLGSGMVT